MADEITVSFPGGKRVDAAFDGFVVATDQPVAEGGEGAAPPPFDLFLASLATCAGIYVLRFCQLRGIPADGVRLVQRLEWESEKKLASVAIRIEVPPHFPEKYREALVRAASQCAVKKAIESPPQFVIETVVVG
ncbi:MAG TPA: OsmC family protein [Thermoanaerobaculales bacterium]|nr:OsmC family protein [Thermoanaerobaculales bacterium]HPA80617.1 OsmC family protein [Thermoanaerobaculales bacterium]HQL30023.1 OsmC family protein [Thermoanaerobaculales bacterium]HQN97567.1 OsmC family protein [Thermoanaerobaculales bacterium]HQP44557.1 OsmC family protein [Thermoanaerobaculales bacterium]